MSTDSTNTNRIQVGTITPRIPLDEVVARGRCYMGISLDNPVFRGGMLTALVRWAVGHFGHCQVVVGDTLRRHNEQILHGSQGSIAIEAARAVGDAFLRDHRDLFASLDHGRLCVIRWDECLSWPEYRTDRKSIDALYAGEPDFRSAVQRDAFAFVKRMKKRSPKLAVSDEQAIELSSQYLLEEIAVFSALSMRSWSVELYPGPELEVLVKVASGAFANIPQGLRQRVNVELKCISET
ncbi:MAG: tRNA-dependent cyclodipeptide synthase [Phycisphaerae bacterium]|nr:tRNA-dependent cyclodipeptide synthase [Phycisphaerae bacterium]